MNRLFRYLFLAKEIKSKSGELHFQRWRIVWTPLFAIYIHYIAKSDEDKHPHNHPWDFISMILSGGYKEKLYDYKKCYYYDFETLCPNHTYGTCKIKWMESEETYKPFNLLQRNIGCYHHIELLKPTWTLVLTGGNKKMMHTDTWGYLVNDKHVNFEEYRKNKNEGKYNDC